MNFYLEHSPKPIGSLYTVLYHMIAFIYVTSKPPSGHKMRNKSTKSPDRNRLNVIKCKTTETFQTFYRNTNMVFYTNNVA